jgi:hypothetical protein
VFAMTRLTFSYRLSFTRHHNELAQSLFGIAEVGPFLVLAIGVDNISLSKFCDLARYHPCIHRQGPCVSRSTGRPYSPSIRSCCQTGATEDIERRILSCQLGRCSPGEVLGEVTLHHQRY